MQIFYERSVKIYAIYYGRDKKVNSIYNFPQTVSILCKYK